MTAMARICLQQVDITFPIVNATSHSLQLRLYEKLGGELRHYQKTTAVRALKDINLELRDGDRIGLVGPNGSGKTTLLRVLAGIYPPTAGHAVIEGKVSSLADITLGMDWEATGWENIKFRCAFMGLSFAEADALTPSIAEFSELGEYLALPIRIYSRGMFLRLAFAISTCIRPDILVMDEMIGAGDESFLIRAKQRTVELVQGTNILALATHNMSIVREICNRVIWLDRGSIKQFGPPDDVISAYLQRDRAGDRRGAAIFPH